MKKCPNCGNEFTKSYCNNCGQKLIKGKLTTKMVLSELVQNVFLFDSTLYKTLMGLLISPGILVKSYLEGKKKKYLHPFQFFLLFMAIYLFVLNFFGDSFFHYLNNELLIGSDKITKAEMIENFVRKNLNVFYFILTPIIAFFIYIFNKKTKFNYAEILIFAFYIIGVSFFLSSVVVLLGQFNPKLFVLKSIIIFGYFPFAIWQFTNSKSFLGVIKTIMILLLSYLTYVFIVFIIATIYVFMFLN